jgi:predicted aspartyl protease
MRLLICALLVVPAIADGPPADPPLKSLYESGRWTDLREALPGHGPALYRGAVAAVFNEDRLAERLLRPIMASDPHSEDAYQAYEWLAHVYFRRGRYRQFIAAMEARWAAFPDKGENQNERAAVAGFRGLPDQVTGKTEPAKLAHEPGEIFMPISVNGGSATFFFDTGAWVNCISEAEAKRLGLTIHEADGTLGTGTGARVGFRTAVAREVVVGKTRFQNVSFAVFRDDQEPWSDLPVGRRGLIGIPVILGLGSLRWTQDGSVEIGMRPASTTHRKSNLFFDGDHLVVAARLNRQPILASLDTGAQTTDLYENFAKQFQDLLARAGKKDATEVRGVGQAETFDSITLPEVKFEIGEVETVLRPAHVLLKQIGTKRCVGNFGMDLLKQGRAFRIDLRAMTLTLEPNP